MTILRVAVLFAAPALLAAACGGGPAANETVTPEPTFPETLSPTPTLAPANPSSGPEAIYSPVVLAYRGVNNLVDPSQSSEGFEFVLGAPRAKLEEIERATVRFPDGRTQDLNPSTDLGVSLDFFGYYGTTEGLPPAGDYVFEIVKHDGSSVEVVNHFAGNDAPLPAWVNVDIDRTAGTIDVTWADTPGVRNYTVALQDIDPQTGAYTFVPAVACPDPHIQNPDALDESYWTSTECLITGLNDLLTPGKEYGVQVAVWANTFYGGIDGADVFNW